LQDEASPPSPELNFPEGQSKHERKSGEEYAADPQSVQVFAVAAAPSERRRWVGGAFLMKHESKTNEASQKEFGGLGLVKKTQTKRRSS